MIRRPQEGRQRGGNPNHDDRTSKDAAFPGEVPDAWGWGWNLAVPRRSRARTGRAHGHGYGHAVRLRPVQAASVRSGRAARAPIAVQFGG